MAASALAALADALTGHGGPSVTALTAVNKALLDVCAGAGAAVGDEGFLRQAWPLLRKCAEWAWALVPSLAAAEPLPKSYRRLWFELLHACGTASEAEAGAPGPVSLCCADKTDVLWTVAKAAKWASALPEGERWVWGYTLSEPLVAWFDALVLPMDPMALAVALAQVFVGCWPWDLSGWVTETCAGHPWPFLVSFTAKQPFHPKLPRNMARAMVMCWHRNCDLAEEALQRCAVCTREPGQGAIDTVCMSPACMPQDKCTCARELIYFLIHATRLVGMVGDSIPSITDPMDIEAYGAMGRFLGAAMGPWGFRHVKQVFWSHTGVVLDWLLRVWLTQCTWTDMFMSHAGEERWLPLAALTARLMLEHDFARSLGTLRPMLQPEELLFSVQHTVNPNAWCHRPLRGAAALAVAVLALVEKDEAAAAVHYPHLLCCLRVIPLAWPTGVGALVLSSIALRTARVCQSGKFGALNSQETMQMLTTAMQYRLALERDIESALCRTAELVGLVGDLEQWVPLLRPWSDQPWVRVWWMMCLEAEGRSTRHHAKVLYKVSRLDSGDETSRDLRKRALALGCIGVEDVLAAAPFAGDAVENLLRTAPRHFAVSQHACGGSWVHVPMCGLLLEATKFLMQLAVCVLPQRPLPGRDDVAAKKIRNKSKRWADKVVRDRFKSCRTTLVRPDPAWAELAACVLRVVVRWAQVIGDCTDDALRLAFAPKGDDVYMWRDHLQGPVMALYIAAGCCYAEAPEGAAWRGVCKVAGALVSRWVLSWDEDKWDSLRRFGDSYSGDRSWITAVMTMDHAIRVSPETCADGVSGTSGILPLEAVAVLTLHTDPGLRLARDVFRRFRVVEHAIESGNPLAAEEILRCALFLYWAQHADIVEMTDEHATALVSLCDLYGDAWAGKPQTALWRKKWDRMYAGPMTTAGRIAGAMTRVQPWYATKAVSLKRQHGPPSCFMYHGEGPAAALVNPVMEGDSEEVLWLFSSPSFNLEKTTEEALVVLDGSMECSCQMVAIFDKVVVLARASLTAIGSVGVLPSAEGRLTSVLKDCEDLGVSLSAGTARLHSGVHEARRQLKESLRREVWRHMRGVMEVLYEVYGYCRLAVKKLVELSWLVSATQMEQNSRRGRTDGMAGCLKWWAMAGLTTMLFRPSVRRSPAVLTTATLVIGGAMLLSGLEEQELEPVRAARAYEQDGQALLMTLGDGLRSLALICRRPCVGPSAIGADETITR